MGAAMTGLSPKEIIEDFLWRDLDVHDLDDFSGTAALKLLGRLAEGGFVIAPREPTRAMSMAGFHAHLKCIEPMLGYTDEDGPFKRGLSVGRGMICSRETDAAYKAMIALIDHQSAGEASAVVSEADGPR